jgi:hypothetical protein
LLLDNAKNFAKVTVSTGYTAASTSIVLTTGHGAKLPTAPFNAVWWNSTDYADPSDDPNVEIVRVTAISTDTLTVTRAQEGTSASTKNTASKTYKMIAGLTAKVINTDFPVRMRIATTFESSSRFLSNGSGGTPSFETDGLFISTSSSTNWRKITALTGNANFKAFSNSPIISGSFVMSAIAGAASMFMGIGDLTVAASGHTFSGDHIGIKVLVSGGVASLYGTVGDGTEAATAALTTIAAGDSIDWCAVVTSNTNVAFYYSKNGGAWSSAVNLTTHIPSSSMVNWMQISVAPDSTTNTNTYFFNSYSYER